MDGVYHILELVACKVKVTTTYEVEE